MAIFQVPLTKGGGIVTVDTADFESELHNDVYHEIVFEGLKVLLNKGISGDKFKVKDLTGDKLDEAHAAIRQRAEKNLELMRSGQTLTKARNASGSGKVPAKVLTVARQLARDVIRNEMRKANIKVSLVPAKDITALANQMIAEGGEANPYVQEAIQTVAAREAAPAPSSLMDISSLIKVDPTLVAKAEKAKAERKEQLSAKQASKPKAHQGMKVPPARKPAPQHTGALH